MEALKLKDNPSGIEVVANRILIKPDEIKEKTRGGIIIPMTSKEKAEIATCYGVVVDIGPDCFIHSVETIERKMGNGDWVQMERKTIAYSGPFVEIGDRVAFSIYSGHVQTGADGEQYKTINDIDITNRVSAEVTQTTLEARKPLGT